MNGTKKSQEIHPKASVDRRTTENRPQDRSLHSRRNPRKFIQKRPWTDAQPRIDLRIEVCIHVEIPKNSSKSVRKLTRTQDLPTRAGHQPCPRTGRATKNNERCNCGNSTVFCTLWTKTKTAQQRAVINLVQELDHHDDEELQLRNHHSFQHRFPSTRPPPQPPRPHLRLHRPARTSAPTPTRSSRPKPHACCHVRPPRTAPWPHGIARTMGRDNVGELGDTATVV